MSTHQNWPYGVGLAAIAFTLLAVPAVAVAQTDQQTPQKHVAPPYAKKHTATRHRQPYVHRNLYGWDQRYGRDQRYEHAGCENQFPPCQSTFPEGSPSYHGPQPGVTFDDQ